MSLVRDDCLLPTLDAKELGYIRESSPQQYVADVLYKVRVDTRWSQSVSQLLSQARGEYGTDVMKEARPLPLEYLIIELTTTSPCNPQPLLPAVAEPLFPVENRAAVGQAVQVSGCRVSD